MIEWSETPVIWVVTGTAPRNGPTRLKKRPICFMPNGRIARASSRSSFGYTNGPTQAML